ncbi:guanine nucleotide exchange factor VAV3-like isoform X2 [Anneissia japonica]|uniref:guanine nucleotide exchange factor VAV3-like isoform X2 n=1 Tax=Anneissia japonica TaxID=1529436 RepID=UPI001425B6C9|nr:guanine nucleotide exchange factor VAV3-like isoform X2 [Anneissia japonica]
MTEPWQVCTKWLIDCKVIPKGHRVTWTNAVAFDLAQTLRDGVVLCQLLNMIKTGTVDLRNISLRPQMLQFSCLKNIRVFLEACAKTFNLKESQLFPAQALYDVSDFGAVIKTLSFLSRTREAAAIASPFTIEGPDSDDDQIYKNLEELADEHDIADEGEIYETMDGDDENEDVYADLMNIRRKLEKSDDPPKKLDKRKYCVDEIVDTEERYVEALDNLVTKFIRPLSTILSSEDRKKIFLNIEELYSRHFKFSRELYRSRDNGTHNMSNVFIKHKDKFLIYGFYCSFLTNAQRHIDEVCKSSAISRKIEECQMKYNENKFSLRDLLNVPMQRILKYHLLLRELIKHTDRNHPDKAGLDKALEEMQDLSLYVNEVKRDHEIMQTNAEMEKSLVNYHGASLNDFGRIQKDGDLRIKMLRGGRGAVSSSCFLFDRVLLICEKRGKGQESHEFKHSIDLSCYMIEDNLPKGKGKWNWCFWLTPISSSPDLSAVEIYTKTGDMMTKWVDSIRLAKDNINPKHETNHAFEYTSFTDPTYCDGCKKLLRGIFFQGYKCSRCKKSAHKECLSKKIIMTCRPGMKIPVLDVVKAKYAYSGLPPPPDSKAPLYFEKLDVLEIYEKLDDYWWRGCNTTTLKVGYIPTKHLERPSYVPTVIQSNSSSSSRPASVSHGPQPGEKNLFKYKWYVGTMERISANEQLKENEDGCFLVRERGEGGYAISIKYDKAVKHMKVLLTPDKMFYLVDAHPFPTLPQLIEYYQRHTLAHVFQGLDSTLKLPVRDANQIGAAGYKVEGYATALYDFAARGMRELSLKAGQTVAIISKAGGHRGWWKGRVGDKEGYFPSTYVQEDD